MPRRCRTMRDRTSRGSGKHQARAVPRIVLVNLHISDRHSATQPSRFLSSSSDATGAVNRAAYHRLTDMPSVERFGLIDRN